MSNHGYAKDFYLLGNKNILKKLDDLEEANNCLKIQISAREEEYAKYKKAIDEALEYIENYLIINEETGEYCMPYSFDSSNLKKIYDILNDNAKGDDK